MENYGYIVLGLFFGFFLFVIIRVIINKVKYLCTNEIEEKFTILKKRSTDYTDNMGLKHNDFYFVASNGKKKYTFVVLESAYHKYNVSDEVIIVHKNNKVIEIK